MLVGMLLVVAAYIQGRSVGKATVSQKQTTDWLNQYAKEAKARADIQSITNTAARKQLLKRWGTQ
jgi:hypothetical protein